MKHPLRHLSAFVLIAALGSSSLCAQGSPAPAVNPATVPVPRNDWIVRHEGFNAIAKKGGVDLLFLGDSITDGWAKGGKAIWDTRYAPLKAANFGIGGDKTEHVLWRLKNGNLTGIQPKVVVLMIGTNNNLRDTAPGLPRASPQSFRKSALNRPPARSCCSRCFPGRKNPPMPGGLRLLK